MLLPSSEGVANKLSHCYVASPQIFYPALVTLPAMPYMPEMMEIIARGYPFSANIGHQD